MISDVYVANDTLYRLLENGDADADFTSATPFTTDMFSKQDIVDTMNRIQQQFMLATGMIVTRTTQAAVVGQAIYNLPVDNIRPRRITWTDSSTRTSTLTQADTWELDNGLEDWGTDTGTPFAWHETTLPQQQIAIAPTPDDVGQIGLLYIALAKTLDGTGVALTVPDDWAPYIVWGVLAELLNSDGVAFDPVRAGYCERRFDEGVELARLVLGG